MTPNRGKHGRDAAAHQREKEALRVQAAAVAAQQAALLEEENRLQQRRSAMEHQEAQLAAHLDEKRRRLAEIRNQARDARQALSRERAAHEEQVAKDTQDLAAARRDVTDLQEHVGTQRHRLSDLRRKLKCRLHRHWLEQQADIRRRREELAEKRRLLETADAQYQQDKAELERHRLRFNGDAELKRRQMLAGWKQLRAEQQQWRDRLAGEHALLEDRARQLQRRATGLARSEQALAENKDKWDRLRLDLEQEAEGLNNRIRNQRAMMVAQEKHLTRLQEALAQLQGKPATPSMEGSEGASSMPVDTASAEPAAPAAEASLDREQQGRMEALETVAAELADQRAHLAEQCQRLVEIEQTWQKDRAEAAAALENVGLHLEEKDRLLTQKEQAVDIAVARLQQEQEERAHQWRQLEGWQTRLTARESAWMRERDRILADATCRQEVAKRHLSLTAGLRRRWQERRAQEVGRLRSQFALVEKIRRECIALRDEWLTRRAALEEQQRKLVARHLLMEQYWQQRTFYGCTPEEGEKRLAQWRQRWAALACAAERILDRERNLLVDEGTKLEDHYQKLQQTVEKIGRHQADLSQRETAWEHEQAVAESEFAQLRQEIQSLKTQRDLLVCQVGERTEEVERLVQLLIEDRRPPLLTMVHLAA